MSSESTVDEVVVDHARHRARELLERGKEKAVAVGQGFEDVVKDRPIPSILIAAGVGVLIGFLVARR